MENTKKKSIGTKLMLILGTISLTGMIAVFLLCYFVMRSNLLTNLMDVVAGSASYESERINSWFTGKEAFIDSMGYDLRVASDLDITQNIVDLQHNAHPEFVAVYVGLSNNEGVFSIDAPDYDVWKATERGWYKAAIAENKKVIITSPYRDLLLGGTVITIAKNIGQIEGLEACLATDISVSSVIDIVSAINMYGGYAFLIDEQGEIVTHINEDFLPTENSSTNIKEISAYSKIVNAVSNEKYLTRDYDGVKRYIVPAKIDVSGWTLYVAVPQGAVNSVMNKTLSSLFVSIIFLIAAAILVGVVIKRVVVKPLNEVMDAGQKLAEGDLTINISSKSDDEIGRLMNQFGAIVKNTQKQASVLEAIANKDFSLSIEPRTPNDTMNIAIQTMIDNMSDLLVEIQESATQVSSVSKQVTIDSRELAQGSLDQARTIEQLSGTIAAVAEKTKESSSMAEKAANLADTIKQNAEKGSDQMERMNQAVKEINDASASISKIISVIDSIAFQTNILALNAAVEAARAGQHGKGFAVVAEEVRSLASKSADAARDTGSLISNSMEKAQLGASIAKETAQSLDEIVSGIIESSSIVNKMAVYSEEQNITMTEVNKGFAQVTGEVQQNTTTAEQSSEACAQLNVRSEDLQGMVAQFKLNSNSTSFTKNIREQLQLTTKERGSSNKY